MRFMGLAAAFAFSISFAQEISLRQIMDDPIWIGRIPDNPTLSPNGDRLYFQAPRERPLPDEWLVLDLETGSVSPAQREDRPYIFADAPFVNGDARIYGINGDLWLARGDGPRKPLLSRNGFLTFVRFVGDDRFVFREGSNLFLFDLDSGAQIQLTDLTMRNEPKEDRETFFTVEEKKMFQYVAELYEREDFMENDRDDSRLIGSLTKPERVYLGKGMALGGFFGPPFRHSLTISEDLQYVAVIVAPEDEGQPTEYAQFITKEGEVKARKARPRVGHETKTWKLGVLNRKDHSLAWLDLSGLPEIKTDRLADVKAALSEEDKRFLPKEQDGPRPVMIFSDGFQPGGGPLLASVFSRDSKDRWHLLIDPETMEWTLIDHHHDPAWLSYLLRNVGFAGSVRGSAFWRSDGKQAMFVSDQSGYYHFYGHDVAAKKTKQLTKGQFEVFSPVEDASGKNWLFHSNKVHPGELHFYRMPLDGGPWTALTREPGHHGIALSEDGSTMADLFSKSNAPPVLRVKRKDGAWKTVYDGRSDAFKAISWMEPQVTRYRNRDGKDVYARLYKPQNPNGAGVVFAHGAGYLQNAHKGWSVYFREYMFHNLLARQGFTVLDPDFQASAGYGRDWRTAIYRHMGGKDLNDVLDGAKFLSDRHGVDPARLGVYGGSYGGFLALMAMFTAPDVFQAGAALRPVTDWAYYNHWYTSRILNTAHEDPVAYRRSSPIYFADGLKGHLLICHGMVDGNVQFQDSVRLAQKLIELRKPNWELSGYPVEPHSFRTPSGWHDEYRRIHELFLRTLSEP